MSDKPKRKVVKAKDVANEVVDATPAAEVVALVEDDAEVMPKANEVTEVEPGQESLELDATEEPEPERDVLFIHKEECLDCLQLTETGTRSYKKCHFTSGNDNCPAQTIQIVVGVPVEKAANAIARAQLSNDAVRLADLYAKLAERNEVVLTRVMNRVKQILSER